MRLWRSLFSRPIGNVDELDGVKRLHAGYNRLDDAALTLAHQMARTLPEVIALTAIVASRSLGLTMFDEQLGASRWPRAESSKCRRARQDARRRARDCLARAPTGPACADGE
jgi:hypothetical protein